MPGQWVAALLVLVALAGLILALRFLRSRFGLDPELVRKLLHFGMGAIALSFPWIFTSAWPVFALAVAALALLIGVRHLVVLKASLGGVIDAVHRDSAGELYFPVGIALAFWLSGGDPLLYTIPILLLTLADAVAALVGSRYGMVRYATTGGSKSVEGSLAFFMTAFLCTLVPLLLLSNIGRAETLLISFIIGVLIMLTEAVAWRGLDNLTVPVLGFLLLNSFVKLDIPELAANLGVLCALAVIAFVYRTRSTLEDSAMLEAVLIGYVIWALGGFAWLYPPAVLFLRDKLLNLSAEQPDPRRLNVSNLMTIVGPGLIWLILARITDQPLLFFPYVLYFATHLAIFELVNRLHHHQQSPRLPNFAIAVVIGWLMFIPYIAIEHFDRLPMLLAALAIVPVAFGAGAFYALQPGMDDCPRDFARWLRQGAGAFMASAIGLVPFVWSAALHA